MDQSVERAKAYISGALGAMLDLGKGSGPMNHAFDITGEFAKTPESAVTGTPEGTVPETDMSSAGKETVFCRKGDSLIWNQNVLLYMKTV